MRVPTPSVRALGVVLLAVAALGLTACGEPETDVPTFSPTSSASDGDASAPATEEPDGGATSTSTSVELPEVDLPDDQAAALDAWAAFMDDWMAVAAAPTEPSLLTSEHATAAGQGALARLAQNLQAAGNSIQGSILMDTPAVALTGESATVTACLDQSGTTLVATDGTVLDPEAEPRVLGTAQLVRTGEAWQLADLQIGGPC